MFIKTQEVLDVESLLEEFNEIIGNLINVRNTLALESPCEGERVNEALVGLQDIHQSLEEFYDGQDVVVQEAKDLTGEDIVELLMENGPVESELPTSMEFAIRKLANEARDLSHGVQLVDAIPTDKAFSMSLEDQIRFRL